MAYVTEDPRVRKIIQSMKAGALTYGEAAAAIMALPPQENAHQGYLDWEVEEALKS